MNFKHIMLFASPKIIMNLKSVTEFVLCLQIWQHLILLLNLFFKATVDPHSSNKFI